MNNTTDNPFKKFITEYEENQGLTLIFVICLMILVAIGNVLMGCEVNYLINTNVLRSQNDPKKFLVTLFFY